MATTTYPPGGCQVVPKAPLPVLPFPLSVAPPHVAQVSIGVNLCCQVVTFATPQAPIPFGALVLNPAVVTVIRGVMQTVQTYIDALAIECPRET